MVDRCSPAECDVEALTVVGKKPVLLGANYRFRGLAFRSMQLGAREELRLTLPSRPATAVSAVTLPLPT
jgi:hypothetical protein